MEVNVKWTNVSISNTFIWATRPDFGGHFWVPPRVSTLEYLNLGHWFVTVHPVLVHVNPKSGYQFVSLCPLKLHGACEPKPLTSAKGLNLNGDSDKVFQLDNSCPLVKAKVCEMDRPTSMLKF